MSNIKDIIKYRGLPAIAKGHPCIELKDPLTGKIKERIEGDNHVFTDALFSGWWSAVSSAYMVLSDDDTPVDNNFPYMLGNVVGYGVPSQSGSGTYCGAYNSTNQILASMTPDKISWKFQYDFTTSQANGTIKSIGLTRQYGGSAVPISGFKLANNGSSYIQRTCDGRYTYSCTTAGIITKHDLYTNTSATIDISAIVGTSSSISKNVGYASDTGKFYVLTYSSTVSDRHMYVFSNSTFSTLETTYSTSNLDFNTATIYIYGDYVFNLSNTASVRYADFVNNTTPVSVSCSINNPIAANNTISNLFYGNCAWGKYIICGKTYDYSDDLAIFDMSAKAFRGRLSQIYGHSSRYESIYIYPLADTALFSSGENCYNNAAIAKYILPSPVTKTSSYGMTATYELEVDW